MSVEESSYRFTFRAKDTFIFQQAFDGALALLLAIDIIEEQFGLTTRKTLVGSFVTTRSRDVVLESQGHAGSKSFYQLCSGFCWHRSRLHGFN